MAHHAPSRHLARSCLALASAWLLAGCGAGSGIVAVGPGTWMVAEMRAPALGGGPEAQRAVLARADAFCRAQARVATTLSLAPDGDPYTPFYPTAFDDTFRCDQPK
jgi:hypothetical protein